MEAKVNKALKKKNKKKTVIEIYMKTSHKDGIITVASGVTVHLLQKTLLSLTQG